MLPTLASYLELTPEQIRAEINGLHLQTIQALAAKGISYGELRNALSPQFNRTIHSGPR